jgi:hypothetical protein
LRSNVFRISSSLSAALLAASFLAPSHRIWFICAATVVSLAAMLPALRAFPYSHRLDIHNRRDRRFLLFVALYIGLVLVGASVAAYFGTR